MNSRAAQVRAFRFSYVITMVTANQLHFLANKNTDLVVVTSSVASLKIKSRYANIFVFIDCENNQFLKK